MTKVLRFLTGPLGVITAMVFALSLAGVAYAVDPTPAPKAPIISMTKTAAASEVAPGTAMSFTITVTNSGFGASGQIALTDVLPSNAFWAASLPEGCSLKTFGSQILSCEFSLEGRHLNDSQTEFVNSSFSVTVHGLAGSCGETYRNGVIAVMGATVFAAGPAIISTTPCPAPVTATPSPTQAPTQAPTQVATATPPAPQPTASITTRPAPAPPETGNANPERDDTNWLRWLLISGSLLVIMGGVTVYLFRPREGDDLDPDIG